tara:strand:+ start:655 stop:888 length:234 start_codon:yes stop_codon:yes gene_type:complete
MEEATMDKQDSIPLAEGENTEAQLPPGIKTEAVLSFLGNISRALTDITNGINETVTLIVTEGTKNMEQEEGDTNEDS